MNKEIERKFLIEEFDESCTSERYDIIQGYIHSGDGKVVRVRTFGEKAYITIKYRIGNISRAEFEYEIPYDDALNMINNCCDNKVLKKTRFIYYHCNKKWEIDVFKGKNHGLILGEIELSSENEEFEIPSFIVKEVTNDKKYSNHILASK